MNNHDALSTADQLRQLAQVIEGGTVKAEIHATFEGSGRVKWEIDLDCQDVSQEMKA